MIAVSGVLLATGLLVLLGGSRWCTRLPLRQRIGPHLSGRRGVSPVAATGGARDALVGVARLLGVRLGRLVGVHEDLDRRLRRVHAPMDAGEFRLRQLGWALLLLAVAAGIVSLGAIRGVAAVVLVSGAPMMAYLVLEQQLASLAARRARALEVQLPVVAEQVAMLLGAGRSVLGALERVAERSRGEVARDLAAVVARVHQGVEVERALQEWAGLVEVEAVERFAAVLALHRDAGDLGRLLALEARGIRRDVQRGLIEVLERRAQQVWVPVTVATLVPGVLFLGVPFVSALDGFLVGGVA